MATSLQFTEVLIDGVKGVRTAIRKGVRTIIPLDFTSGDDDDTAESIDLTNYEFTSPVRLEAYDAVIAFQANGSFELEKIAILARQPTMGEVTLLKNDDPTTGRVNLDLPADLWQASNPPIAPSSKDRVPVVLVWVFYTDADGEGQFIPIQIAILRGAE